MSVDVFSHLRDDDVLAEAHRLARDERQSTATLIACLAELYARRLHERAGYESLFTYCVEALRLSESAAYDRMKAAKLARRFPLVLEMLHDGRLNLTALRLAGPHLTRANHGELLAAVAGKRKRQVLEELARRFPQPDVPTSVTPIAIRPQVAPPQVAPPPPATAAGETADRPVPGAPAGPPSTAATVAAPPPPTALEAVSWPADPVLPLSPDRCRLVFTTSTRACEKLQLAQDLLRHAVPTGDVGQVFERAIDELVEALVKQKFGMTDRPRPGRAHTDDPAYIPVEVKRAVFIRDRGRCAYVGPDGHACGARGFLEFHHVVPSAAGGKPTVDNISLRCRGHNQYEGVVFYGPMKEYVPGERVRPDTFSFRNENARAPGYRTSGTSRRTSAVTTTTPTTSSSSP